MNLKVKDAQKEKPIAVNTNYRTSKECFIWLKNGKLSRAKYSHFTNVWTSKGLGYLEEKKVLFYCEVPTLKELK